VGVLDVEGVVCLGRSTQNTLQITENHKLESIFERLSYKFCALAHIPACLKQHFMQRWVFASMP
jgi:Zn ribbon nucleic-acid-binding protein